MVGIKMKQFKDNNNVVFAYEEDGSQDHLIGDKVAITKEEANILIATPKTVDEAKAKKLIEIESDFVLAESQTVIVNAIEYAGGATSARDIRDYIDLTTEDGLTVYKLWDVNGTESNLTLAQANTVKLAIANQASTNKFTKKDRKVALASLPAEATIAEVEAI